MRLPTLLQHQLQRHQPLLLPQHQRQHQRQHQHQHLHLHLPVTSTRHNKPII